MCLVKYSNCGDFGCLPVVVNTAVLASQVGFQQFRAIERFSVEGSNKHSDRGHSSND